VAEPDSKSGDRKVVKVQSLASAGFASEQHHNSKQRDYFSFAYSAFACFRIGMSGSASFQRVMELLLRQPYLVHHFGEPRVRT
jgi:hypothetical protein